MIDIDDCMLYAKDIHESGYGLIMARVNGKRRKVRVHRMMFEHYVRPLDKDEYIDHLCRVMRCINPDHLEAVSWKTNVLRGESQPAKNSRKTHCIHGHEFTPENTRIVRKGNRSCKTCARAAARRLMKLSRDRKKLLT